MHVRSLLLGLTRTSSGDIHADGSDTGSMKSSRHRRSSDAVTYIGLLAVCAAAAAQAALLGRPRDVRHPSSKPTPVNRSAYSRIMASFVSGAFRRLLTTGR